MKILIIGSDARAHALCARLVEEGHQVYAVPPSVGARVAGAYLLDGAGVDDATNLRHIHEQLQPDLTVVCHIETSRTDLVALLVAGGHAVFGPDHRGAILECSKAAARQIGNELGLPQPAVLYRGTIGSFRKDVAEAGYDPGPAVLKADGLAGGLGVAVCEDLQEILAVLDYWESAWGEVDPLESDEILLEEVVRGGIEVSFGVFFDGFTFYPLCTTFEHKRQLDHDMGTMTAEMGTLVLPGVAGRPLADLFIPVREWLQAAGYRGFIDVNTFLLPETGDFRVIEWTCRFGDPEIEIALELLDEPLGDLMLRVARGNDPADDGYLVIQDLKLKHQAAVGVVIAGGGYPYPGAVIQGLPIRKDEGADFNAWAQPTGERLRRRTYFMGVQTQVVDGREVLVSKGGRHLLCVGTGSNVGGALASALYEAHCWRIMDSFYRRDIGKGWIGECRFLLQHGVITPQMAEL